MRRWLVISPNRAARNTGIFLKKGKGKNIAIPTRLNSKWAMAMLNAASDFKIAASKAVMVVPRLMPIINGNAFFKDTFPVATMGTIREVVTELDCTAAVKTAPHANDFSGFLKTNCPNFS